MIHNLQGLGLTKQRFECLKKAEFRSKRTGVARAPRPSMHETFSSGWDLVPPKFLGEWNSIMFLFGSVPKITVSISSTRSCNLALFETPAPRMSLKAWSFLFPASLLVWLVNQSAQVGCICMVFKNYSLIRSRGLVARPMQSKSKVEMRLWVSIFASPQFLIWALFKIFGLPVPALSPSSVSVQTTRSLLSSNHCQRVTCLGWHCVPKPKHEHCWVLDDEPIQHIWSRDHGGNTFQKMAGH